MVRTHPRSRSQSGLPAMLFLLFMLGIMMLFALSGCATSSGTVVLPKLTPAQLQTLTTQVCTALTADVTLLEGPTGKALLTPSAQTKVTTIIGPTVDAVCASGANVDPTSLQTLNNTVVPALIDIVGAVPQIPYQPEILAGLTLAQVALVPIVNQALAAAAASSSAPAPPPAATKPVSFNEVPQQNRTFALIESPQAVGGATAALTIAGLQAFWHYSTSAPTAAALTVIATLGAAYLQL